MHEKQENVIPFDFKIERDAEKNRLRMYDGDRLYVWVLHSGKPVCVSESGELSKEKLDKMRRQAAAILKDMKEKKES
jgi:hypothetical protein